MSLIYQPRGKAREYSPLALNIFTGCPHGCKYCYVPEVLRITPDEFLHNKGVKKSFSLAQLDRDAKKIENSRYPVFLSFTSDPYPDFDQHTAVTRDALKILLKYNIPVIILSKGGRNWDRDIDIFEQFGSRIKIGATLTFASLRESVKHEPKSSLPHDRIRALKNMHDHGFMTWGSIEPVVIPSESIKVIKETLDFVDEYRVGKITGNNEEYKRIERETDWTAFLQEAVDILRDAGKRFYVKQELAKIARVDLTEDETDLQRFDTFIGRESSVESTHGFGQIGLL